MHTIITIILTVLVVIVLTNWVGGHHDETDEPGGKRSGFILWTDYGTGVQYLVVPFTGVVPRLGADGKPVVIHKS